MDCNIEGIALNRVELVALLSFTATEESSSDYYGVTFVVEGDRCWARATDGRKAVEADGTSDGKFDDGKRREWFVYRDFLIACRKLIAGKQVARLMFKGASLHDAKFEGTGDDSETETSTLTADKDAASAQSSAPDIAAQTKLPSKTRDIAKCVTLAGPYLATLTKVAKAAATESIDCYPPKDPSTPAVFRIGDGKDTHWTVAIMPVASVVSHEAEQGKRRRGQKKADDAKQTGMTFDGDGNPVDPGTGKASSPVANLDEARAKKGDKKAPAKKAASAARRAAKKKASKKAPRK